MTINAIHSPPAFFAMRTSSTTYFQISGCICPSGTPTNRNPTESSSRPRYGYRKCHVRPD